MSELSLYAVISSGFFANRPGNYCGLKETNGGKICAIAFTNVGTNSNIKLSYGGAETILEPGDFFRITAPLYGYDTTDYSWVFVEGTGIGTRVDGLNVSLQKYA
jgi:hypothetical protein